MITRNLLFSNQKEKREKVRQQVSIVEEGVVKMGGLRGERCQWSLLKKDEVGRQRVQYWSLSMLPVLYAPVNGTGTAVAATRLFRTLPVYAKRVYRHYSRQPALLNAQPALYRGHACTTQVPGYYASLLEIACLFFLSYSGVYPSSHRVYT